MRTLDDIIPPSKRREIDPAATPPSKNTPVGPSTHRPQRPSSFPTTTILIIVVVIAASVAALFYFSSAKIEVTPTSVSAAVQGSFSANQSSGTLPFEIISAQKIATQSVASTGTKTVNSSASGTITIYNTQSKAQKLITNTRFATAAGLVFKIHNPVTVPAGSPAKPGSINAPVYAAQTGVAYNVGPSSFTVPAFDGTPLSSQVYARSQSAMTGGASGVVPVVDAAAEGKAKSALMTALAPELNAALLTQVPPGYLLIAGAATTTYQELTPTPSNTTGQVDIKEQGTITGIVFPNAAFAKSVASSVQGLGYQGEPITLASSTTLTLTPVGGFPDPKVTTFNFMLSGTAALTYTIDPARIQAAVSGKTRSAAEVALTNYPEVKRAILILRPFWKQTFPQDPSAIMVITTPAQ